MESQNPNPSQKSQNNDQQQRFSSNSQKLDRLVNALENTESEDSLQNLTSSLQSTYADFGVFDSMALSKYSNLRAKDVENEEMTEEGNEETMMEEQEDKKNDSASKKIDSILEKTTSKTPAASSSHKRSGFRRGKNDATFTITVPTKNGNKAQPRTASAALTYFPYLTRRGSRAA